MSCRFFAGLLLLSALPAQVGPGLFAPHAPSTWLTMQLPPLSGFSTGSSRLISLSAAKLNGDPPGFWTLCLSLVNAIACPGCDGTGDTLIVTADLNTTPPTMTPTNQAALITSGYVEMFKIEPGQGLLGVYELFHFVNGAYAFAGVYLADRPSVGAQFGNPRLILNVNGIFRSFADPAIGYVNDGTGPSKLKLFWVGVNYVPGTFTLVRGIWMQDLDISAPATPFVRGPLKLVAVESRPTWAINSPAPIAGPDGDVEGMLVWERDWQSQPPNGNPNDNDAFFADDFDPNTPDVVAMDTLGTWSNNGTVLGNLILAAETYASYPTPTPAPPIYQTAHEGTSAWLIGDTEPIGSGNPVDIRVGAPIGSAAFVFISTALLPVPVPPPPGPNGQIGIGPAIGQLGFVIVGPDAIGDFSFPTPTSPSLAGVWHLQGVAVTPGTSPQIALTNTAKIRL